MPTHTNNFTLTSNLSQTKYFSRTICKKLKHKDGLVNGSDDIFKAYTKYNDFDIVWIRFNDSTIRQQQCKKLVQCHIEKIKNDWVPILRFI